MGCYKKFTKKAACQMRTRSLTKFQPPMLPTVVRSPSARSFITSDIIRITLPIQAMTCRLVYANCLVSILLTFPKETSITRCLLYISQFDTGYLPKSSKETITGALNCFSFELLKSCKVLISTTFSKITAITH